MELRQVVALSATSVVMCFSTPEHSDCRLSRDASLQAAAHNRSLAGALAAPEGAGQGDLPSAADADRGAAAAPEGAEAGGQPRGAAPTEEAAQGGQPGSASAGEAGFLPALQWEPPQQFHGSRVGHLEVQRLSAGAFVVCFDHPAGPAAEAAEDGASPEQHAVVCSLGAVAPAGGLQPFGPQLRLGAGRLVAVVARGNGRSFSVCARGAAAEANASEAHCAASPQAPEAATAEGVGGACAAGAGEAEEDAAAAAASGGVTCRWAEVQGAAGGGSPLLRWAGEEVKVQGL
ncbi:unnamed protein product [Prorocentrum cordatum]|uniref:Anaphase-promoting complex subunit 1 n=1 Tax=Prorocentrum cordatum TaxID=2364126 RepID=A0ABN9TCG6_9DINO|nr:unnamed protein product [Polarella glacialis]